ncbi:MAG: peptidase M28 [Gemmatimonadetes bacterium]|nr:MAG: peptidase M28 [Gemmatimonadota bacterium]
MIRPVSRAAPPTTISAIGWPRPARRCAALEIFSSRDVGWLTATRAASIVGPTLGAGTADRTGVATSAGGVRGASACCARADGVETQRRRPARAAWNAKRERAGMSCPCVGRARRLGRGARSMVAPRGCLVYCSTPLPLRTSGRPLCHSRIMPLALPLRRVAASMLLLLPATVVAQSKTGITAAEIDAHLRFLATDLLEGRAPGTRGGRLAAEYIATELRAYGVEPGVNGSYFQPVPIDVMATQAASVHAVATGKATATLRQPEDVVLWGGSAVPQGTARGELVFVGYGATAPEYKWNDFKDVDVKGKVLLVLVNDPPAPAAEPTLFGGVAMTYYGRWTYKYEEAERRGAAGMLIVHRTDQAGYGWQVVVGSNATEHRLLIRDPKLPPPLGVRGWITDSAATALLRQAGLDMATLRKQAESRDFRPVPTGITMDLSVASTINRVTSENVVGVVRGRDPKLSKEYVALSSHWDHLGIGTPVNGDSIYNGAFDNASGVATILAVAHSAAVTQPRPKRSLLFVFVTAEESGLLGSAFFAQSPTVPLSQIAANLNVDETNFIGPTRDVILLGLNKSSLGADLAAMLRPEGIRVMPEEHPERGSFYRSDHFSLAKAGVPAVSIESGTDVVGKPKGFGAQWLEEYNDKRYHQPSDEYRPDFDLRGSVQLGEIVHRFARRLADAPSMPTWNAGAEFHRTAPAQP